MSKNYFQEKDRLAETSDKGYTGDKLSIRSRDVAAALQIWVHTSGERPPVVGHFRQHGASGVLYDIGTDLICQIDSHTGNASQTPTLLLSWAQIPVHHLSSPKR